MGSNSKQQCLALSLLLPPPFYTMGSNSKQQCLALSVSSIDSCNLPHFTQWGRTVNNSALRYQLSSGGNIGFKLPKPTSRLSLAYLHVHQDILDSTGLVNSLKIATS